jgi:hypothetical protein
LYRSIRRRDKALAKLKADAPMFLERKVENEEIALRINETVNVGMKVDLDTCLC